MIVCVYFR